MDSFHARPPHRPLQLDEIRIVTLLPGAFADPIVCTLEHANLDHAGTATYEAVSYAWGNPEHTQPITLDSVPYPVTANLFSALTYLRDRTDPTRLWIDSLCINQQDLAERSAQVSRMRDIFASALKVHVWLGDYGGLPKSDWHLAFQYMLACSDWMARPPKTAAERHRMETVEIRHARGKDVMAGLLGRAWFRRVWVVQEVAVRHWRDDDEKVKLMVGHLTVPWFVMSGAFGNLLYIRGSQEDGVLSDSYNRLNGLCSIAKAWQYKHRLMELAKEEKYVGFAEQLAMYLSRFTQFGTTDQRDRLYSLLGMLVGNDTVPEYLAPDYSKPVSTVFQEYTAWMLREGTCIDLLGLSAGPQPEGPSWVPDFVGRRGAFYRNLDDTNPVTLLDGDTLLQIEAVPLTVVAATGPRCRIHDESRRKIIPDATAEEVSQVFMAECRRYLLDCETLLADPVSEKRSNSPSKQSMLTSFKGLAKRVVGSASDTSGTCNARQRLNKYFNHSFVASLMDSHWDTRLSRGQLYDMLVADPTDGIQDKRARLVEPYARYIADEFDKYSFFICEDGEVDFCRSTSVAPQPGDMLCLLRGSTHRYMLRPVGEAEQWTLVGTAYMDAEFCHDWRRYGTAKEMEMRQTWAAMWKENKEKGNVISVVIR